MYRTDLGMFKVDLAQMLPQDKEKLRVCQQKIIFSFGWSGF